MTLPTSGPTAQSNPDAFVGKVTLSVYEPYAIVSGSAYSSISPAQAVVVHWHQPGPVGVRNVLLVNSMNASVPGATGGASTGSEGYSYGYSVYLYTRQDYAANSSNLAPVATASFGLSASMGYSSTSQQYGMSWVTDTTGGTLNFSTTSNDGGWSNYATGPKVFSVPLVTSLSAGEYWAVLQHSSTSATSNSNVTLLSMSQLGAVIQAANATVGSLGASVTDAALYGPNAQIGGLIAATPTTSTTMAASVIVGSGLRPPWIGFRNF